VKIRGGTREGIPPWSGRWEAVYGVRGGLDPQSRRKSKPLWLGFRLRYKVGKFNVKRLLRLQ